MIKMVTLLTKEDCGFCEDAKPILQRLSQEYAFAVETVDLQTPEGARLAEGSGMLFPPGVFIDGEPFCYGRLSERRLRKELDMRSGEAQ